MPGLPFGHPFAAVLVAPVILSAMAFKHLRKKKASNYDVFLSFCDDDAPKNFADCLYKALVAAGVCVFRADDGLHRGKKIGPDLVQAIKSSKISIPILSRKYASCRWCLDELVQIMDCRNDSSGHIVLPIFHGEPADVRSQIDGFGQNVVEEWKRALTEVSYLKGWESGKIADGHEGKMIELVVLKVLVEFKKAIELIVTENSVGIKNPMKEVMIFVDNSPLSIRYVGIYGKGGVGKTTLAKVIYNKLLDQFDHCSFIADVRESCKCNGIECLQSQLIFDILKEKIEVYNKDQGIIFMSSKFRDKKVLIVLDDVNAEHQLEALAGQRNWFAAGSRIIVTTRDKGILDRARVDDKYEHTDLDIDEAKILFARHAFVRDSPPSEFAVLSDRVVSTISRIPLTLEVIGSYLCGKSMASWEDTIKQLLELPQAEVRLNLRLVYQALMPEQKKMFLDVACFLVGSDARSAPYMWEASDSNLLPEIEELIYMSLIKIGDNHELRMHDELRDLGWTIVHERSCNKPDEGSGLCDCEEAWRAPQGNKETGNIWALSLDKGNSKETVVLDISHKLIAEGTQIYTNEQFENLQSLQFLHVSGANLRGDFSNIFTKLRWLRWERCPQALEAKNFGVEELDVLDLSRSLISDNWEGWSSIVLAKKLKVLNLTGCHSLESTFFLSAFENLEILILRNCDKLETIYSSIGDLKNLISLDLRGCFCLKVLPKEVGNLKGLKELLLDQTQIQEIPSFIGSFTMLEMLSAKECKLLDRSLVSSNASLPDSIGSLVKLRHLSLQSFHNLSLIPNSIGKLESLTELVLARTIIKELPKSIENLQNLGIMNISRTDIKELPDAIGSLRKLRELDASWCTMLRDVSSIRNLSSLQRLDLLGCVELPLLPKLPSNLTVVGITCKSIKMHAFSHLIHLKQLQLYRCIYLERIPDLPSTPLELEVLDCGALEFLTPLKAVKGFKLSLKRLDIIRCKSLERLDLSQFNDLRVLYARDCEKILKIGGLDKLNCLESLTIQRSISSS